MTPSRQWDADASPAVWDHAVLPATRYRQTLCWIIYGRRARPLHITALTSTAVKPIPMCTAWWTEAHVCEELAQGRCPSSKSNLQPQGSSACYHYTIKPHQVILDL